MENVKFTLREMLVGIVIILVMTGLGFFIAESIRDNISIDNERYFKALKVNNDPGIFDYAIRTEVGAILSYGEFKASQPVSDHMIKGRYFSLKKIEEHYTMHTRIVSYKCGKSSCSRTETYWTWDEVARGINSTKTFNYLGRDFNYNKVNFDNYKYLDTINTGYDVRFVFYTIPIKFNGTLYLTAKSKSITDTELYVNQKIKSVINDKVGSADNGVVWFWALWIILTIVIVVIFGVLENKFLNDYESREY